MSKKSSKLSNTPRAKVIDRKFKAFTVIRKGPLCCNVSFDVDGDKISNVFVGVEDMQQMCLAKVANEMVDQLQKWSEEPQKVV